MDDLSPQDWVDLARAKQLLNNPSLAVRITDFLGKPIEKGLDLLPEKVSKKVHLATRSTMSKLLRVALATMETQATRPPRNRWHKVAVAASGGAGGAFGLAALPFELPVSTTLIFRSISEIARSQGEDLTSVPTQLACLEVFALGGRKSSDDAAESGYFAVRAGLAKAVTEAAEYLAKRGMTDEAAPALVRLITAIGARFGIVVSQKVAAAAIPVVGALGGATLNTLFIDHFQDVALGHFTMRRLERRYGPDKVRWAWDQLTG